MNRWKDDQIVLEETALCYYTFVYSSHIQSTNLDVGVTVAEIARL